MDTKTRASGRRYASLSAQPSSSMTLRTSWTTAALSTNGSGTMSRTLNASIQNAAEYSALVEQWREVRLRSFAVCFSFSQPYNTTITQIMVVMGTDPSMNATTYTAPSGYADVMNLSDKKCYASVSNRLIVRPMLVNQSLDFTNIDADSPTLPVPYAGSPGVLQVYATGGTNSTVYTTSLLITATYQLRGRR